MTVITKDLLQVLRLEIDAADLTNQITNHSGQAGNAAGWEADGGITLSGAITNPARDGQTLLGTYMPGGRVIRATVGATASNIQAGVRSQSVAVAPGQYLGWAVSVADPLASAASVLWYQARFYNSGGVLIGNTSGYRTAKTNQRSPWQMTVVTNKQEVPAGAVTARIHFELREAGGAVAKRAWYLSRLMVVVGPTAASVTGVQFGTEGWQDFTGSSLSARVVRGGQVDGVTDQIDPGTLTAVIKDAAYDPTSNPRVRPGRAVRISATFDGGSSYRTLMTGRLRDIAVAYADSKTDRDARPRVSLVVSDVKATAESEPSPYTYSGTFAQKVRALMAAASVAIPFAADTGSASTTKLSAISGATLWQQLQLAANSFPNAKVYVDAAGTLQAKTFAVTAPAVTLSNLVAMTLANYARNPSASFPPFSITYSVTVAVSSAWAAHGSQSALISAAGDSARRRVDVALQAGPAAAAGDWWSATATVRAEQALIARLFMPGTEDYTEYQMAAGEVRTLTLSRRAQAGASLEFRRADGANIAAGSAIAHVDCLGVYASPLRLADVPWVSGYSAGGQWSGAVDASWSQAPYRIPSSASYTDIDTAFGSRALVNQLELTRTHPTEIDGEKVYGPFVAAASVQQWGAVKASLETVDGDPTTLATDYLQRYASPSVFPEMVRFNALEVDAWALQLAALDLYAGVRVVMTRANLDTTVVLLSIEHEITPSGWWVTWRFRPADVLTSVPVTNQSGPGLGPVDVVPPPAGIVHSRRIDVAQSIGNALFTTVIFDLTEQNVGGAVWNATDGTVTVPRAGRYLVSTGVRWQATTGTGQRQLRIHVNGGNRGGQLDTNIPVSSVWSQSLSRVVRLAAGDVVSVVVYQDRGGALELQGSSQRCTFLDVTWLGE